MPEIEKGKTWNLTMARGKPSKVPFRYFSLV